MFYYVRSTYVLDFCLDEFPDMFHIPGGQRMEESHILAFSILLAVHDKGIARGAGGRTSQSGQLFAVPGFFDIGFHVVRKAVQNFGVRTDVLRINTHLYTAFSEHIIEQRSSVGGGAVGGHKSTFGGFDRPLASPVN